MRSRILPALPLLVAAGPALAAGVTVDLTGIATAAVGGAFSVFGALALAMLQAKIKNKETRDLLDAAVRNSLGKIQQATDAQLDHAAALHPSLPPALAVGVQYVADHAPEALDRFGITPGAVADKIEAQIGLAAIATNLAVSGNATTAVAAPLEPVPATVPARAIIS